MKGFPNQVSDLSTLAKALAVLVALLREGRSPKNDGVFGEALVRRGVLGTGHRSVPVEQYLTRISHRVLLFYDGRRPYYLMASGL